MAFSCLQLAVVRGGRAGGGARQPAVLQPIAGVSGAEATPSRQNESGIQ